MFVRNFFLVKGRRKTIISIKLEIMYSLLGETISLQIPFQLIICLLCFSVAITVYYAFPFLLL